MPTIIPPCAICQGRNTMVRSSEVSYCRSHGGKKLTMPRAQTHDHCRRDALCPESMYCHFNEGSHGCMQAVNEKLLLQEIWGFEPPLSLFK